MLTPEEKDRIERINKIMDECIDKMEKDIKNEYLDKLWPIWKSLFKEWSELHSNILNVNTVKKQNNENIQNQRRINYRFKE